MLFVYNRLSEEDYIVVDSSTMEKLHYTVEELMNKIMNGIYIAGVVWIEDRNIDYCMKKLCRHEYGLFYKHKIKGYDKFTLMVAQLKTCNIRYIAGLKNGNFQLDNGDVVSLKDLYRRVYNELEVIGGVDSFVFKKQEVNATLFADMHKLQALYRLGINLKELKPCKINVPLPMFDVYKITYSSSDNKLNFNDIERITTENHIIVLQYNGLNYVCKLYHDDFIEELVLGIDKILVLCYNGYKVFGFDINIDESKKEVRVKTLLNSVTLYYGCNAMRLHSYGTMISMLIDGVEYRQVITGDKYVYKRRPFYLTVEDNVFKLVNLFSGQSEPIRINKASEMVRVIGMVSRYAGTDYKKKPLLLEVEKTQQRLNGYGKIISETRLEHILYDIDGLELKKLNNYKYNDRSDIPKYICTKDYNIDS